MATEIVQAQYDELERVAARFGQQAEAATALQSSLKQAFQPLANGDWAGLSADAFISEMDTVLFPALARMIAAL